MGTLWQDVRYGLRAMVKRPGFTVVVVLSLALGIGGATTVFSLINAVLLHPLPYRSPDRLVYVWEQSPQHDNYRVSAPTFRDWQQQSQTFEQMALIQEVSLTLTDVDQPERLEVGRVSAGFFDLLGVSAAVGRTFQPLDDRVGAAPVVVLSDPLWARRFGRDPKIIGKTVTLGAQSRVRSETLLQAHQLPHRRLRRRVLCLQTLHGLHTLPQALFGEALLSEAGVVLIALFAQRLEHRTAGVARGPRLLVDLPRRCRRPPGFLPGRRPPFALRA